MIRELVNRMVAGAVAAGAALVAVVALGAAVFYALSIVLTPLGAASVTAALFALIALIAFFVFNNKAKGEEKDEEEDEEPEGLPARLMSMVQQRPVIGIVAALATGAVLLKKPGLAALALTAFNEHSRSDSKASSSRSKNRHRSRR